MKIINKSLEIVGDFLIRFYHEEPNEIKAATKAVNAMTDLFDYEWEVANAFRHTLKTQLVEHTLRDIVRNKANRYAQNDEDAKVFLQQVYEDNDFDNAINFEDLKD